METLPRDSASPEDCSHVGALKFWRLCFAQSDLPRGHFLRADAVLAGGKSRCEGQDGRTY